MNLVIVVSVMPADDVPAFEAAMPDAALLFTLTGDENETIQRLATGQQISLLAKKLGEAVGNNNYTRVLQ